jgi:predicted glycosyltransferase
VLALDEALTKLLSDQNVRVVLLPRSDAQRSQYGTVVSPNLIVPATPLDGPDLIAACDLVISAGGTINREAAALGVPAASIYAGKWAAVDEELIKEGRLQRISQLEHLAELNVQKKADINPRRSVGVINDVVNLILDPDAS